MMRPVYRWKSFWFGMLVVGFLEWGWVRSMGHYDTMGVGIGDSSWSFEVTGGCVEIERESAAGAYGWIRFFEIDSGEFGWGGRPWFPPAIERFNRGLVLRRQFVEGVEGDPPDPFADPDEDPELARAEREELADLQYEVSDYMTWRIAWWFLVLVFVAPWGAFLAWRWMRMKRPATGSAEPPARRST